MHNILTNNTLVEWPTQGYKQIFYVQPKMFKIYI